MTTELIHKPYGNILINAQPGLADGDYKILIPRGTHFWRLSVEPYKSPEPGYALLAFDAPPVAPGTPVGTDTRETLARAWAGETLAFHSEPLSSSLTISTPEDTSTFRADRDRWLYLRIDFPGPATIGWQSRITLHADAAPEVPAPTLPEPDLALAQRTLAYANEAGLVAALRQTARAANDEELVGWLLHQGDLWFAICRLAGRAEGRK